MMACNSFQMNGALSSLPLYAIIAWCLQKLLHTYDRRLKNHGGFPGLSSVSINAFVIGYS